MTKLTRSPRNRKASYVSNIVRCLIAFTLILCFSAGLAEGVNEYLVYPWDVYQAMSMEEKAAFTENFEKPEDFDDWAYLACLFSENMDDESRALLRQTWAEFNSMMNEQKDAFVETLGDYVFEAWMAVAQRRPMLDPLYIVDPMRCAWVDFEAMDIPQKEALFERFESAGAFEAWMAKAQDTPQLAPALVENYLNCTWAEFSAMPVAQKEAFFELFEEAGDFEKWMFDAQERMKKPAPNTDLTWEELEAMDIAEKEAFFESFESAEAFEAWMEQAKKQAE